MTKAKYANSFHREQYPFGSSTWLAGDVTALLCHMCVMYINNTIFFILPSRLLSQYPITVDNVCNIHIDELTTPDNDN